MPKKKNTSSSVSSKGQISRIFLAGFAAECYLLLIYNLFINANSATFFPMYYTLQVLQYAGLGIILGSVVLLLIKKGGRLLPWYLAGGGAFLALASFCGLRYWGVISVLCVVVPVAVLYVLAFFLFQRDFFLSSLILGGTLFSLWLCRKGLGTENWNTPVTTGVFVVILLLACFLLLVSKAEKEDGLLHLGSRQLRLLPKQSSYALLYGCSVLSVAALVVSVARVALAYYAIWIVAVALFVLVVYYTIKQL